MNKRQRKKKNRNISIIFKNLPDNTVKSLFDKWIAMVNESRSRGNND